MYARDDATERPNEPAFVLADAGEVVTFGEFEAAANRAAHLFRSQGLQTRDHVAFLFENNLRMLELEGGAERTGLYYTCINSYLAPDEVAYIVSDSDARIVVTSVARDMRARCFSSTSSACCRNWSTSQALAQCTRRSARCKSCSGLGAISRITAPCNTPPTSIG